MNPTKIDLKGVHETLLLPLWGRSVETKKEKPLLSDPDAVRIIDSMDYDFSKIQEKVHPLNRAGWVARSIYFDRKIKEYLEQNPEGAIINIGCGLDTTYERTQNGKATWYELDFPEVIEIRKKFLSESKNRVFLPFSVFDQSWYSKVKNKKNVFIMIAGVIYFFDESEVKALFKALQKEFDKCTIVFDYSSIKGKEIANKKTIEAGGMDAGARLKWGMDNIKEIESWGSGITVKENMTMFREHRKKYPFGKRIGMWISDSLRVMSLAQITMNDA
jgi:O-methyltransferase involved in polyketide biosynthesis